MRDLSNLVPPPVPSDERVDHAADVVVKLSEVEAIWGQVVSFKRDNLECTGVWPKDCFEGLLAEVDMRVPDFYPDSVDLDGSYRRHTARCRLLVRHAVERSDLDLELMRQALEQSDARKAGV